MGVALPKKKEEAINKFSKCFPPLPPPPTPPGPAFLNPR